MPCVPLSLQRLAANICDAKLRKMRLYGGLHSFVISANVDNLTTVVLMLGLVTQIVKNHYQRVVYASAIIVAASMGGCFTAIGDMTSVMLWVRDLITPSAYAAGLFLPSFLC